MPSTLDRTEQQDFSAGMVRDEAPQLIDPRGAFDIINGLLDDDGSIYRRGGTANKANAVFGSSLRLVWDGYLGPGRRTVLANTVDFGVLGVDDATVVNLGGTGVTLPGSAAEMRGLLFLPGGWIYGGSRKAAAYSTGTISVTNDSKVVAGSGTVWLANLDAGMILKVGTDRAYVIDTVDSDTQFTLREVYEGTTASGASYTASHLLQAAAPYESAAGYTVCADRLVWAVNNKVRFSGLDSPHSWDPDDEHELPEGARVLGLAAIGQTLMVFATNGLYTIEGLGRAITDPVGNAQHRVQQNSPDIVALSSAGTGTWQGQLIVPALDTIWLVDGVSGPTEIGHPIENLWRSYVALGYRPGQAAVFNSHYFLPVVSTAGGWIDLLVCRLDRPIRARGRIIYPWSRFQGAGGQLTALARRSVDAGAPVLLGAGDAGRLVDCSFFFRPDGSHKNDHDGSTHGFQAITRDYLIDGVLRKAWLRRELLDAATDNPTLEADYSRGEKIVGQATWNSFNWNAANWAAPDDTAWVPMPGSSPENSGQDPFTFHVNKRFRFVRLRLRSSSPAARLTIRALTLFFRRSQKAR